MLLLQVDAVAQWQTENPVNNSTASHDSGAYDPGWNLFWYGSSVADNLVAVYNANNAWVSSVIANNWSNNENAIAVDYNYHWTFYVGTNQAIWVAYYANGNWSSAMVGKSTSNSPNQLCVDSIYHICYYVDGNGSLWAVYLSGSTWNEKLVDSSIPRNTNRKRCGVDNIWHIAWYLSVDQTQLVYAQPTASGWNIGALNGTYTNSPSLSSPYMWQTISVDSNSHLVYGLKTNSSFQPLSVQAIYVSGSNWVTTPLLKDGNLPSAQQPSNNLLNSPQTNSYYLGSYDGNNNNETICGGYLPVAQWWGSRRQDDPGFGASFGTGTTGLFPLAIGNNAFLACRYGTGGVSVVTNP